ncbi:alkaline phosphatase D family protein [Psychrobacter sp. N25K4-3-2]|jgi:alkaline phosphatase D|uniref:alkaline phosphatase D family protein n=1 Tax=Psychrobacter sp. N25K4-3-2 TaxID=2785026 RepID=UPI00188BB2FF|nr:alkaline phosphatase D family protein [Psychrobacter sp. N25K4-3-2]MBF4489590.1 alkaline phosphatase D family protein [Psychrobacter sp. N25K4-3-2]
MKRREFIKLGGQVTVAGTLLTQLSACSSDDDSTNSNTLDKVDDLGYQGAAPFVHGIASGDPLHDRVILWTRITNDGSISATSIPVGYVIATDPELKNIVASGRALATSESDFTVKVDPKLPQSNTTYYYAFEALGYTSPIGRTRTIPNADLPASEVDRVRLAVVSCSNYGYGYFNGYADIAKQADISAVLHLGDYIYEYPEGFYRDQSLIEERPIDPKNEIISLEDYRRRYACYRTDIDLQECHRQHPFIAVWDDHEIADNSWKGGARFHTDSKGSYIERKMSAVRAYHEWMPIRDDSSNELDSQLRIYRRFEFGKLFDLNMLDTRIFGREKLDATASNEPERQLLGLEQENWLYLNMLEGKRRDATWQILGQQVILAPFKGASATNSGDIWNGYASARDRLLNFIEDNNIDNTVVLTGDYHASFAFDVCKNPFDASSYNPNTGAGSLAVEFVCPALTSLAFPENNNGPEANPHQKFNNQTDHGYMLLDITEQACQCDWYYTDTLTERDDSTRFAKGLYTQTKTNHLVEGSQSRPITNVSALAAANKAVGMKI